jgi:hypothetical protein
MRALLIRLCRTLRATQLARRLYRRLPSGRRCKECYVPFIGLFSIPFRLVQIRPSRKNPHLCTL